MDIQQKWFEAGKAAKQRGDAFESNPAVFPVNRLAWEEGFDSEETSKIKVE